MAERDEKLSHNYDGIEEYDNDLPRWWVWLFWLTIVFAVVRVGYYHFGPGKLQFEQLADSMAELEEIRAAATPIGGETVNDEVLLALAKKEDVVSQGSEIYTANCLACHAPQGQGLVGPNLTDNYWIHGGSPTDIHRIIVEGVPEKGMVPWKDILNPEQIRAVTAYVWTLHGTNPPNPKDPEGELFER